jgi:trk system potassium uptake protein TrkA
MHVIIVGCGRVGSTLALRLDVEGHSVCVIDKDPKAKLRLPKSFDGRFLLGIGFDWEILEEARIAEADAFVAVTSGDNSNIVAARTAREEYRVPKVVARIYDPRRADIYRDLGISTVASVRWSVNAIHHRLFHQELAPEMSFGNGENVLLRAGIPGYLAGRKAVEFEVEGEIGVIEITRGGRSLIPGPATTLEANDVMTFVVSSHSLARLKSFLDMKGAS